MTRGLFFIIIICIQFQVIGQLLPDRYNEEIFSTVLEIQEVQFSTNVPTPEPGGGFYEFVTGYPLNVDEFDTYNQNLYMDIFEPEGDTISKRPLVVICFGGGFLGGSKDHWSMRAIAQQLAKRGYVTATIDYRLGMNIFDEDLSKRAPYRGLQDGRSAIRYFKADAATTNNYKIDTNNIYIGGHSAGAFIALHNAYLDKDIERPLSTYNWVQDGSPVADQLCLDCVGDNQSYNGKANAVFSLAGALGDPLYLESSDDPTVVLFHSEDDDTVPITSGTPFSGSLWLVIGDDLPDVYGSQTISEQANSVGLDHQYNAYVDRGHAVHEETGSEMYDDIIPKISDSFYVNLLKPIDHPILGQSIVCSDDIHQYYSTIENEAMYYDWTISGGTIINLNNQSNQIEVIWDINASEHLLYLTPYSCHAARGEQDSLIINIHTAKQNIWLGDHGVWSDQSRWDLNHLPLICEDVYFPNSSTSSDIYIPDGILSNIRSMHIGSNRNIHNLIGSSLTLQTGGGITVLGSLHVRDQISISKLNNLTNQNIQVYGILNIYETGNIITE